MLNTLTRITVFCGSSNGSEKIFTETAFALGQKLADQKIVVVYGGASIGVMGAVADGCLKNNGQVIGIIPKFLSTKEIAHYNLTELITVETMHERKLKMHDLADGFIILPGGIGTLEEFFEILTWAQLGLHKKPIAVLNTANYYKDLLEFIQNMVDKGFLKTIHKQLILVSENADDLLEKMRSYEAPDLGKFITEERT
ncbi:MAG: TIGR00730 family Rossman fold protein [Crocinitomicaceae bacterium]|nr:TIGR00730 family Rossman fold protein [Crocinitomicaceae bacterium]